MKVLHAPVPGGFRDVSAIRFAGGPEFKLLHGRLLPRPTIETRLAWLVVHVRLGSDRTSRLYNHHETCRFQKYTQALCHFSQHDPALLDWSLMMIMKN